MSKLEKDSPEWFEAKQKARADLDTRLALGLPHSSKPIPEVGRAAPKVPSEPGAPKAPKEPKPPKVPKAK